MQNHIALSWYFKIFNFIAEKRLQKGDVDPRRIHAHTVVVLTTGLLMWGYAILALLTIESPIPGIVGIICSLAHLLSPLLFRVTSNVFLISNIMLASGIIHQGTFSFFCGGFRSMILIWFGILPMLGGIIAGKRGAVTWAVITSTWAGFYLYLDLGGYQFPHMISESGKIIAQAFIVFGWIFLSSIIIYVMLILNENKEKILDEQSRKIDDLFRVLFHDLANPLGRMSIGINLARREAVVDNHGLEIASQATDSMLEITQSVRKMYAVSKGKVDVDLCLTSLNKAVEYIQRVYAQDLESKNLTLNYDSQSHQGLKLLVEPVSFNNQVLGNIMSNAIKFSSPGSFIEIKASSLAPDYFKVEIIDHGIGMPKSIQDSLFDLNKKTSRRGTSGEAGTGFGMHIMKSFVEMYQGKVEVKTIEKKNNAESGTTIKLYLNGEWN